MIEDIKMNELNAKIDQLMVIADKFKNDLIYIKSFDLLNNKKCDVKNYVNNHIDSIKEITKRIKL